MANLKVTAHLEPCETDPQLAQVLISVKGTLDNGSLEVTDIMKTNLSEYAYVCSNYEFLIAEEYLRREFNVRQANWLGRD